MIGVPLDIDVVAASGFAAIILTLTQGSQNLALGLTASAAPRGLIGRFERRNKMGRVGLIALGPTEATVPVVAKPAPCAPSQGARSAREKPKTDRVAAATVNNYSYPSASPRYDQI